MKKMIIVRHGEYDSNLNLSEYGVCQMKDLVKMIARIAGEGVVRILSSSAVRAAQSANVLASGLTKGVFEKCERLWSDRDHPEDLDEVLGMVNTYADTCDVLVLVTHLEYARDFPSYYSEQVLKREFPWQSVEKGEMVAVDCARVDEVKPCELWEDVCRDGVCTGRVDGRQVDKYVRLLYECANPEHLLKVYLYGSVVKMGVGNDADIVVEVPEPVFVEYANDCIGALDGFHPIEKLLLDMYSPYWDYASPDLARLRYIFKALHIDSSEKEALFSIIHWKKLDMLCLPEGWNEPGHVNNLLKRNFNLSVDPDFFKKLSRTCKEISR